MIITFNGRNLTISFFIPRKLLTEKESNKNCQVFQSQLSTDNQQEGDFIYIEFDCKSIKADKKIFNKKHYVDIQTETGQVKTYNENKAPENLDEVKTISLRLIDEEFVLNKFMNVFYEKFETNQPMVNDNPSIVDKESIMTFQTTVSMVDMNESQNLLCQSQIQAQQLEDFLNDAKLNVKAECATEIEKLNVENPADVSEKSQKAVENAKLQKNNLSGRPKRQIATKNYNTKDVYDESNISDFESDIQPYQKYKEDVNKSSIQANDGNSDSDDKFNLTPPGEIRTKTITRRKIKKVETKEITNKQSTHRHTKKRVHYNTDDEDNENVKSRRGRPPKKSSVKKEKISKIQSKDEDKSEINNNISVEIEKTKVVEKKPVVDEFNELLKNDLVNPQNVLVKKKSLCNGRVEKKPPLNIPEPTKDEVVAPAVDNIASFNQKRKLPIEDILDEPEKNNKKSRVEEWLQSTSDSFDQNNESLMHSDYNDVMKETSEIKPVPKLDIPKDIQNNEDNESNFSAGMYATDEHQNYSSSSQESIDLDVKMPCETTSNANKSNNLDEKSVDIAIEKAVLSQNDLYSSQTHDLSDPCKIFETRANEIAEKLNQRRKKLDDNEKQIFSKYERSISHSARKCLDQTRKTKMQLKTVMQLYAKFQEAKLKLITETDEQQKLSRAYYQEIEKRREAIKSHNEIKKEELLNIKQEAVRKNEELMHEIWREYIDNFQTHFNNTIKKAYEI